MRVFSHGSNVNFQSSSREMFFPDLEKLLNHKLQTAKQLIFGIINPNEEQIMVLGSLAQITLTEDRHSFEMKEEKVELDHEQFFLSQEAIFTIQDEQRGQLDVDVLYLTYNQGTGEQIYFFIDEETTTYPLSCVVQFYPQVKDVGRDVDFSLSGCTASQWKPLP